MQQLLKIIITSRPAHWLNMLATFWLGLAISGASFTWIVLVECLLICIPGSLILFGLNDIYDYDTDIKNPRKNHNELFGTALDKKLHKIVYILSICSAILLMITALFTQNWFNILSMAIIVFIAFAYSVPPFRFKTKPPMDIVCNILGTYALIAIGYSFGGDLNSFLFNIDFKLHLTCLLILVVFSLYGYLADHDTDLESGIKTSGTLIGKKASILITVACMVISTILIFTFSKVLFIGFIIATLLAIIAFLNLKNNKLINLIYHLNFVVFGLAIVLQVVLKF